MSKFKEFLIKFLRLFFYGTKDDITVMILNDDIVSDNRDIYKDYFKDDLLNRKYIALNWTESFLKNGTSKVIAVDASWGMGKTYFATNWVKMLKHDNWQVCYIDAFEYDFTDDPFMIISHSIIEMLKSNNNFTELEDIANYLGILFRAFKSNAINAIPSIADGGVMALTGAPNDKIIKSAVKKITDIVINTLNKSSREDNGSIHNPFSSITEKDMTYNNIVKAFKKLLEKKATLVAKETGKPLVIIIDELDRCKPTFAIEFLEKLKHIFDIDNLVFVTFINHNELANAVKGMYGESFDGEKYLDKFFNLKLTFHKIFDDISFYGQFIEKHLKEKFISDIYQIKNIYKVKNMFFNADAAIGALNDVLRFFQELYRLSLRDIENITEILKYMYFIDEHDACNHVILRIIYLYNNDFYNELKQFNQVLLDIDDKYKTFKKVASLSEDNDKRIQYGKACDVIMDFMFVYDGVYGVIDGEYSLGNVKFSPINTPKHYMNNLIRIIESISE